MSALTRALVTQVSATIGTSATDVLAANTSRNYLRIFNPSAAASIAYTLDGTDPVVNGNGITLGPLGASSDDIFVPVNKVRMIASAGATPYTILWA